MCCKDDETCSQGESGTSKVISFGSAETSAVKAAAEGDHCHDHDHDHDHACTQDVNKPFNFPTSLESPFHGLPITMEDLDEAFYTFDAWINLEALGDEESLVEDAAQALQDGKVIAWFQGRSELGQRALGARSILANPQIAKHRMFINQHVKHREWYRPLAPSVLEDHVRDWFEDIPETCQQYSPFMSFTAMIKSDKISQVPAVAHIDGSARLQSVSERTFPLYHKLISRFFQKTKIPMILNTSLNGKDQPILEKPIDAIKALISSAGSIDYLYVGGYKVSLKTFPFQASSDSLSEEEGTVMIQAQPLYLYETTSTSQPDLTNSATGTIRVRIQDVGTEQLIESEEGEDSMQWLELPSELHLNILQLLQAPPVATEPDTNQEKDDGSVAMDLGNDAKNELATSDLWNAIQQIDVVEDDHDEDEQHEESPSNGLTWTEVRNALRWLYQHALISFEDPFAANDLLDNAFEGAEVVDMRAFS